MLRAQWSRTPLSKQAVVLRVSLLLSLGLSPLGCSGSAITSGNIGGGGSTHSAPLLTGGARDFDLAGTRDPGTGGTRDSGTGNAQDTAGARPTGSAGGASNSGGAQGYSGSVSEGGWATGGGSPVVGSGGYETGVGGNWVTEGGGSSTWNRGGASGSSGAAGNMGAGGGTIGTTDCPNPVFDSTTKLTQCSNGRAHRPVSTACTYNGPGGAGGAGGGPSGMSGGSGGGPSSCITDADCSSLPNGFCDHQPGQPTKCKSACVTDADCGFFQDIPQACACDGVHPGRCVLAGCRTDTDCGPNSLCALVTLNCAFSAKFQCTSPADTCTSDSECPNAQCLSNTVNLSCSAPGCGL